MTGVDRRMLHTDAFAWYMEKDPGLRSTVVAVAVLDRVPDWDYLRGRVERLTHLVPRLRETVQEPPWRLGPPRWVPDDSFDLDFHLRRVRLPAPGDWDAVLEVARTAAMDDFDRSRPLWEFTLLEGLAGGRTAFVTKIHHALADGIGGLEIAALALDLSREMPPLGELPAAEDVRVTGSLGLVLRTLRDDAAEAAGLVTGAARTALPTAARLLRSPAHATRSVLDGAASVGRIVRPIRRTASPLMTDRRLGRHLATIDLPLPGLLAAAHAADGHLNDAFLAGVTAGLRRYHERHGAAVGDLRVTVPVSIRRPGDEIGGNRITLLRFAVPVAPVDTIERTRRISRIVEAWRREPGIAWTQGIAFGLNLAPRTLIQGILRKVDFVASDVPGMRVPVYLAGARLLAYYPFGPTIGTAVNATLMSYLDTCSIGVNVDRGACPDAERLVEDLRAGFDEVLAAAPQPARKRRDVQVVALAR
jgi:diacylglycerol O-acyltransferase